MAFFISFFGAPFGRVVGVGPWAVDNNGSAFRLAKDGRQTIFACYQMLCSPD